MQTDARDASAYQRLLDETARKVGMPDLAFDDDGMCWLRVGDTTVIVRRDVRLQGLLLLREVNDPVPDAPSPLAIGTALHPLLEGAPVLCRLDEGNRQVCMAFLPLREFAPARLLRLLASLVEWRVPSCAAETSMRERESRCFDIA